MSYITCRKCHGILNLNGLAFAGTITWCNCTKEEKEHSDAIRFYDWAQQYLFDNGSVAWDEMEMRENLTTEKLYEKFKQLG